MKHKDIPFYLEKIIIEYSLKKYNINNNKSIRYKKNKISFF